MKIEKSFEIDCAHVLQLPYESRCRNLHGHTYRISIIVNGNVDPNGMVKDYVSFPKQLVNELDHKFLVAGRHVVPNEDGTLRVHVPPSITLTVPPESLYIMDDVVNSTAEEIARHLFQRLTDEGHRIDSVIVSETAATKATYP